MCTLPTNMALDVLLRDESVRDKIFHNIKCNVFDYIADNIQIDDLVFSNGLMIKIERPMSNAVNI